MTASAMRALAAAAIAQQDMIAGCNPGHLRTDRLDHACALVPEDGGARNPGFGAQVGVTEPGRVYPDENLIRSRLVEVDRFERERRIRRPTDRGGDLHQARSSRK
jgi:hypothetical protein